MATLCVTEQYNHLTPSNAKLNPISHLLTLLGAHHILHMVYTLRFSLQNAVCFIILTYLVPLLFTFYIRRVLKLKKNYSGAKSLIISGTVDVFETGIESLVAHAQCCRSYLAHSPTRHQHAHSVVTSVRGTVECEQYEMKEIKRKQRLGGGEW
jgi:hypothetical protein